MGQQLMAIVAEGGRGRIYLPPDPQQETIAQGIVPPEGVADTDMPDEALGFRVQNYGLTPTATPSRRGSSWRWRHFRI